MDGPLITVDVEVNPDDLKAYQAYMKRLPINREVVRSTIALDLAVSAVFLVGLFSVGTGAWGVWLMYGAYLGRPLACRLVLRRNRSAAAETFNGRLTIEPSGLTMERPGYTSRVLSTAIADVTATERHFFVCIDMGRAWVIPRRCFTNVESLAIAETILREIRGQRVQLSQPSA